MIKYLFITLLCCSCTPGGAQKSDLKWTKPDLKGHWKLYDTEIVDKVPFLNLQAPNPNPMNMVFEDSPWDSYTEFDLVFEADSMYMVNYPIQAFTTVHYFLDSGYLHVGPKGKTDAYPVELVNDTLVLYRPLRSEPGYFKEKYLRTSFNDSILNVMEKYGVNYPELAGTWMLVREEDYDYGTHYELRFPHSIPDSIEFSREQMLAALGNQKIYMLSTDGIKRDYFFWYHKSRIYFKPGKWYKEGDDPVIHFYRK
ncbi:MAG: hypothetical protein CVU11_12155 [Bacteroidetes bacterium HGW-Bacteroidetes-6]|jgi:hypothetical protein|nr:MAG: hypothetical protein CVU11_12155 [Bacteroidetes bacterium HGW-Bacteroidetes-6]